MYNICILAMYFIERYENKLKLKFTTAFWKRIKFFFFFFLLVTVLTSAQGCFSVRRYSNNMHVVTIYSKRPLLLNYSWQLSYTVLVHLLQ